MAPSWLLHGGEPLYASISAKPTVAFPEATVKTVKRMERVILAEPPSDIVVPDLLIEPTNTFEPSEKVRRPD